jgi:hypothetical protein
VIPTSVDIFGKPYAVEVVDRAEGDYGECFVDACRIEVAGYQCDHQKRDTLLHEVLHGVDHEMHCNMSEAQIRRMATGLLQVLRHNPEFVAFLTA